MRSGLSRLGLLPGSLWLSLMLPLWKPALSLVWVARRSRGIVVKTLRFFTNDTPADEPLQRTQFIMVFGSDKTDGVAHGMGAAGAADAVDIILRMHRKIIVHHVRNAVHVNAARRDVRLRPARAPRRT